MAKKISQLTQATEVKSDDVTVIVQDGETKKLPLNMMVTKQDIENKKVAGLAKLDEIEATYENDTYTPTITVKNKSSVKTGEGDEVDYSANVMDGHVKSAILKGQTLVNVENTLFPKITGWYDNAANSFYRNTEVISMMKPNTDYLVWIEALPTVSQFFSVAGGLFGQKVINLTNGKVVAKATTSDILPSQATHYFKSSVGGSLSQEEKESIRLMIIEYQDKMENWDISYFEGMQSVKLPVLTTTGKNLFDESKILKRTWNGPFTNGNEVISPINGDNLCSSGRIKVEKGKVYVCSGNNITRGLVTYYKSNDISEYPFDGTQAKTNRFTSLYDGYIEWYLTNDNINNPVTSVQIEEGSTATSYEPHKSNILTVNEEVTLRGIGDVQDELNLLTGEVTERISEIVLDGSQTYTIASGTTYNDVIRFRYGSTNLNCTTNNLFICDVLPCSNTSLSNNELVYVSDNMIYFNILKTKATTVDELKIYLQSNPITVQYQLTKEPIKTVDLIPSGTHPSTTPYCWKDGHIQLSSSGLLPSLEYSVVTSRAGQISQNAAMIVKNDKRIFDLEILLAGGLVNTTYQALTLQNQVETGLSKVSLSSETEPDYLLYHMIMKLIDEKAYKLDDLAEKVSVFYLYEKLSDEQFETIYAALYPFVEDEYDELPEDDEIIEEPIVDEVLEEVENEVVM